MKTVTFNNSDVAKRGVLALLGKSVDAEGFIVDNESKMRVVTPRGEEVLLSDFAGVRKGSEVFITSDLPSLLDQVDYIRG